MDILPYEDESPQPIENGQDDLLQKALKITIHNIKTPIACIIGALEIYERTKNMLSPEKQQELISTALQEAYKLNEVVEKTLVRNNYTAQLDTIMKA